MRSFKLLLFFSCVLLAQAAPAFAQDAVDLDDGALLSRVKKEIDALFGESGVRKIDQDICDFDVCMLIDAVYPEAVEHVGHTVSFIM